MSKQELIDLKNEIEKAKQKQAHDEGRMTSLMERLKDEFGLNSLEEASKEIAKIEKKISKLDREFDTGFKQLQKDYEI